MILTEETLNAVEAAIRVAGRREAEGDLHGCYLYVLEAEKLLLVAQAKLAEHAIFPEAVPET